MEEQIKSLVIETFLLGDDRDNQIHPIASMHIGNMTKKFLDLLKTEKQKTCNHRWSKSVVYKGVVCCAKCGEYKPEGV